MDNIETSLVKDYDDTAAAGREFIRRNWRDLERAAKDWLVASKHFSEHGQPNSLNYGEGEENAETFLYEIGVLARAADTVITLPAESIPPEARNDQILTAAGNLLLSPSTCQPTFLRLGLSAIRQHQLALASFRCPPPLTTKASSATLKGLGTLLFKELKPSSNDEMAYLAWSQLDVLLIGPWRLAGVGASAYLGKMLQDGVLVPPVAFDICAALEMKILGANNIRA